MSSRDVDEMLAAASGLTYRQLDHWTRKGYVRSLADHPGSGVRRRWSPAEQQVCVLMWRLVRAGLMVRVAAQVARAGVRDDTDEVALHGGVRLRWGRDDG